jgi:hypothetical protein
MKADRIADGTKKSVLAGEGGFILVAALSCLMVLSFIGIAAMNTSNVERQIAHNINLAEKTFYRTDGATEAGIEMIEWNISCPLGFSGRGINSNDPNQFYQVRGVEVADHRFAHREDAYGLPWDWAHPSLAPLGLTADPRNTGDPTALNAFMDAYVPSDAARSLRMDSEFGVPAGDNVPHTNLAIFGGTSFGAGGSIQMAAGYEGKGKGAAGGGSVINYQIWSQTFGLNNAQSVIRLGWRHLIGTEGECRPY